MIPYTDIQRKTTHELVREANSCARSNEIPEMFEISQVLRTMPRT